jgi:orotidine-5'-phosphate decarboxylase
MTRSSRLAAADRLIVALDYQELGEAVQAARRLRGLVRTVKIGSILFTRAGPEAIRRMRSLGFQVMLDLKFFDIPSTVELSCRAAVRSHVALLTVHASGGAAMLAAAVRGVRQEASRLGTAPPHVLAVTVLTSTGRRSPALARRVVSLARAAKAAGCDGVVASAQEAKPLRRALGARMRIVCPGIRPPGAAAGDQARIATPAEALANGADWLVIGRPITAAADPKAAAAHILQDMEASC